MTDLGDRGEVTYTVDRRVARLVLRGHNDLNVLTLEMMDALVDRLLEFQDDPNTSVAVLSGAGQRAFSAGGDLRGPAGPHQHWTPDSVRHWVWWPRDGFRGTYTRLMTLELDKPVIAAINGYCLGGALIAMLHLSDIRVAGHGSSFGLAETKQGMPGGAVTAQLGRFLPDAVAKYMALTGNSISGDDAYRWGLVSRLVPPDEVLVVADEIAAEICELPIEVVKTEKEGAVRGQHLSRADAYRIAQYQYTAFVHEPAAFKGVEDFKRRNSGTSSAQSS
jgi:E-phenylitaconyl-CoA hydratase